MSLAKFAIAVAVVGIGYELWHSHQNHVRAVALAAVTDTYGFIAQSPPVGTSREKVVIVAAQNCPHDGAVRADRLAQELTERNIPNLRISSVTFQLGEGEDMDAANEKLHVILTGDVPIVFVNGRAKPNPDLDEVLVEYQAMADTHG